MVSHPGIARGRRFWSFFEGKNVSFRFVRLVFITGLARRSGELIRSISINIWQSHDMNNPESEYSNKTERMQCLRVYGRKKSKVILLEFKILSVGIFIVCLTSRYLSVCHTYHKPLWSQHTEKQKYYQQQTTNSKIESHVILSILYYVTKNIF